LTSDGLIYVEQQRLAQLAQDRSLPLIGYTREMTKWPGMLMTYGASNVALFNRAAYYVDKILKGAKPADLPVEQAHDNRTSHQSQHRKGTGRADSTDIARQSQ